MVEVFKTNVENQHQATMLTDLIQKAFTNYKVNFDLDDCDRILRVKCVTGVIKSPSLILLVKGWGFHAEVLPDDPVSFQSVLYSAGMFTKTNQLN